MGIENPILAAVAKVRRLTADEIRALSPAQIAMAAFGRCPWCERFIRGYISKGEFDYAFDSIRMADDPRDWHAEDCRHKFVEL